MAQSQLDTSLARLERLFEELAGRLAAGDLTLDAWQREMDSEIRIAHFLAVTLVNESSDLPSNLVALARRQYRSDIEFLNRWVAELRREDITTASFPRLAQRAKLYARAIVETAERAALMLQGIPELPFYPKDRTICNRNCRCSWDPRRVGRFRVLGRVFNRGNFDLYWRLAPAEHCPTCEARARAANPLQVRRGEIINPEQYQRGVLYA